MQTSPPHRTPSNDQKREKPHANEHEDVNQPLSDHLEIKLMSVHLRLLSFTKKQHFGSDIQADHHLKLTIKGNGGTNVQTMLFERTTLNAGHNPEHTCLDAGAAKISTTGFPEAAFRGSEHPHLVLLLLAVRQCLGWSHRIPFCDLFFGKERVQQWHADLHSVHLYTYTHTHTHTLNHPDYSRKQKMGLAAVKYGIKNSVQNSA